MTSSRLAYYPGVSGKVGLQFSDPWFAARQVID
jgi:hypothetical protein